MRNLLSIILFLLTCCVAIPHAEASTTQKNNSCQPAAPHAFSPRLIAQNNFPVSQNNQQTDSQIVAREMIVHTAAINSSYTADYLIGELEQRQPNHSLTNFCPEQGQHLFLLILFRQIIAPNAP